MVKRFLMPGLLNRFYVMFGNIIKYKNITTILLSGKASDMLIGDHSLVAIIQILYIIDVVSFLNIVKIYCCS